MGGHLRTGRPWRPTRRLRGKQPPGLTTRGAMAAVAGANTRAAVAEVGARAAVAQVRAAEVAEARARAAVAEAQARAEFAEEEARAADAVAVAVARAADAVAVASRLVLAVGPSRALAATRLLFSIFFSGAQVDLGVWFLWKSLAGAAKNDN